MKTIVDQSESGRTTVSCNAQTFSEFKKVISHLKKQFRASVIDRAEGPDARRWCLDVEGHRVFVDQSDFGPFALDISSETPAAESLLERIEKSLQAI
jgi:hypothetical protein